MKTLLIGGARSGKSALAERMARAHGGEVVVIATAEAGDTEMAARIAAHRAQRPVGWRTVEAPLALANALREADAPGRCLVVDCLTLWLSNLLQADATPTSHVGHSPSPAPDADAVLQSGPRTRAERDALLAAVPTVQAELILIGNEVGHGIVPLGAANRWFVDENGRLHQALAACCDRVRLVMAGCELPLKG